ncbi:appetite-regulating hormone [Lepisosteus oculatus]|uniref:appetite-regulating hormone n=1 Tax=Lepisosteus oculatus TaxID=7918 RepID=UPI00074043B5|nr:PREDICTED: appetite-regulating hormone isoform X2 [Lepisosteus oculatus]XP_015202866.1 PREDICTED: appetite-regulating hormone isoform X2 [Lepisosteus oculatus]XP_015202867.1 PREDICTED: appetite-regulating hormone isoform X2 [Lepisosteus oculatus]XP_015202868.1 PREDICTED: appetite-regulating hormone isoform X2 [Lepisosteus oculatus]
MLLKMSVSVFLLICILVSAVEDVGAGSSFLSPSQKPQAKPVRKPINNKVGRRDSEAAMDILESQLYEEEDSKEIMFHTPFQIGIAMSEAEYQEYGHVLQRIMEGILADNATE